MDRVAAPADGSERAAGIYRIEQATADHGAQVSRRYQPLVAVTLAVAAGVVWDRYGPSQFFADRTQTLGSLWFAGWWCSCVGFLVLWWIAWRRRRDVSAGWVLLVAAALAGSAWHQLNWSLFERDEIGRYAGYEPAPVCIEAIARETPARVSPPAPTPLRAIPIGERSRVLVEVARIRDGRRWRPAAGVSQVMVDGHLLGIRRGDRLRIFGQLARIAPPLNPGEFDFAGRSRADGQLVRVRSSAPESVIALQRGGNWSPASLIDELRVRAKRFVRALIGPNRAGLAAAILLGAREGLPYEETESYLVTGTIHVLVVSGMNVAILAAGFLVLMRMGWLPRKVALAETCVAGTFFELAYRAWKSPPQGRARP